MPRKPTTSKAAMIDGAVRLIREQGHEELTVRRLASFLGCSTQPIMYHFATVDCLKKAVYARVDQQHTAWLLQVSPGQDPVMAIGLNYVRFAVEEPRLFRFLFQTGYAEGVSLPELIESGELQPVVRAMQAGAGLNEEQTKRVFLTVALFAHGYASLIANSGLAYDEKLAAKHLEQAWNGAVLAAAQEEAR